MNASGYWARLGYPEYTDGAFIATAWENLSPFIPSGKYDGITKCNTPKLGFAARNCSSIYNGSVFQPPAFQALTIIKI